MAWDRKNKYRWVFSAIVLAIIVALALAHRSSGPPTVRSLLRQQAIQGLGPENEGFDIEAQIVSRGAAAVPELIDAIQTPDSFFANSYEKLHARLPERLAGYLPASVLPRQIRGEAMQVLTHHFESMARPAIPALIQLTRTGDALERDAAVSALCDLGTVAIEARPRLLELLEDPDEFVSLHAAKAVSQLGDTPPEFRRSLLARLDTTNSLVFTEAIEMYPRDEKGRAELQPKLNEILTGKDMRKAALAVNYLTTADGDLRRAALPALVHLLGTSPTILHEHLLSLFLKWGTPAKAAVPAIEKDLKDQEFMIRYLAARALERIDGRTNLSRPILTQALNDPDERIRAAAGAIQRYSDRSEAGN